jgi:hypothetical protein
MPESRLTSLLCRSPRAENAEQAYWVANPGRRSLAAERAANGFRGRRRLIGQEPAIGFHAATLSRCAWSCS